MDAYLAWITWIFRCISLSYTIGQIYQNRNTVNSLELLTHVNKWSYSLLAILFLLGQACGIKVELLMFNQVNYSCPAMKTTQTALGLLMILAVAFSPSLKQKTGSIRGHVNPTASVEKVFVFSKVDTFTTVPQEGTFIVSGLKPGVYNVMVRAILPYVDRGLKEVMVRQNKITDLGEIKLQN
jgi:hypothetical protein